MPVTDEETLHGESVPWDGGTAAVQDIRELLAPCAPAGVLRIVLQHLVLREEGAATGGLEIISSVVDVDGNLVAVPLRDQVRSDPERAAALDAAVDRLRDELRRQGVPAVDSLEVVLDSDGLHQVLIAADLQVSEQEARAADHHHAVHDGDHHIAHHAPVLEDLRDRLTAPRPGLASRWWTSLTELVERLRPDR